MCTDVHNRIRKILDDQHAKYQIVEHAAEGRTDIVAKLRGASASKSGKAILSKLKGGQRTEDYVLAVIAGDQRINMKVLAQQFGGTKANFASADDVVRLTGCVPGAVPPFPTIQQLPLLVDAEFIRDNTTIAFNAGRLDSSITLEMNDYIRIFKPRTHDIRLS